jgi:AraC-like DNA-binding protein
MHVNLSNNLVNPPRAGIMVDCVRVAATWQTTVSFQRTLDDLWNRGSLRSIEYTGAGEDPILVTFSDARGENELGVALIPVNEEDIESSSSIVLLATLLARLAAKTTLPGTVFAEVALALRTTCTPVPEVVVRHNHSRQLGDSQRDLALGFIEERLAETLTTALVAEHCGMSVSRFAHAFRHTVGMSSRQWQIHRRIQRAQAMLGNQAIRVGDVAVACGYSEQCHFTRQFASVVGVPPGAWRRLQALSA